MSLFLGIDVGTQGAKAVAYDDEENRVVARGAFPFELDTPRPGAAEQDPPIWIAGVDFVLAQVLADRAVDSRAVRGVGVSGQQHGFVALDEAEQVIRPAKLWCDTETAAEAEELSAALGHTIPAGFTASKILWLARHEPQHFARLRQVLLPHDYVNLHLCGRAVMEAGDASGTGFFDPVARTFDVRAMAAVHDSLADRLPPLVSHDAPIGELRPDLARKLGLPSGVAVAPGSGDNMMSAIGAGAVREDVVVASLGTSGTLFRYSRQPVVDPGGEIAPFCDATGAWLPLLCTMNCTTVTEEVRDAFGKSHEELTALAEDEPAGAGGLVFLPYLAGERVPNWPQASAALLGLRPGSLRPGLLYRAAMEGATLALRHGYQRILESGPPARELRLVGGGSNNPLWRQIVADVLSLPAGCPEEPESAALGAAIQAAAVTSGVPVAEFVEGHPTPMRGEAIPPDAVRARSYAALAEEFDAAGQLLFASREAGRS